jgi:hypothetical protein
MQVTEDSGEVNTMMVIGIGAMLFLVVVGIWFRFLR